MDRELRQALIEDRANIESCMRGAGDYDDAAIARALMGYDCAIAALGRES